MVKPNRKPDSRLLPGQSMVEFALIAPLLFTILFVILQLGLVMAGSTGVNHAALEGARTATIFGAQSIGADPYYGDSRICQSIMSSLSHDGINISSLGTVTIFNPADSTLRDEGACTGPAATASFSPLIPPDYSGNTSSVTWPPLARTTGSTSNDIGVKVTYNFHLFLGVLPSKNGTLLLTAESQLSIEPSS